MVRKPDSTFKWIEVEYVKLETLTSRTSKRQIKQDITQNASKIFQRKNYDLVVLYLYCENFLVFLPWNNSNKSEKKL